MLHRPGPPPADPDPLLEAGDPPAFEVINAAGRTKVVLICDHASGAIPRRLDNLGLPEETFHRHVACDIGCAALTRRLSENLDAPAVLSGFSRLVIDCNRELDDPTSIAQHSDGVRVPGNSGVDVAQAARRAAACFWPYHRAVEEVIAGFFRRGIGPAIVSLHSFTPELDGARRPWDVGVLWGRDPRLALPLLASLRADPELCVGDNEPYSARIDIGYSIPHHAAGRGFPHVQLELRQDRIETSEAAAAWAEILADALARPLADPGLYREAFY